MDEVKDNKDQNLTIQMAANLALEIVKVPGWEIIKIVNYGRDENDRMVYSVWAWKKQQNPVVLFTIREWEKTVKE